MPLLTPDPTFYPSPTMAMQSPAETLAYLALINPAKDGRPDALGVVDVDPQSGTYGQLVGRTDMTQPGDELHHFGWNACSSCLCPYAPHPHMERRYLIVPGINSSRIHILDTKFDPMSPAIVKVIEPETLARRTGYGAPHTVHCGPDGIYMSALGAPDGNGPGGTFLLDSKPSTCSADGRSTAGRRSSRTTCGGTWGTTPWSPARGVRSTWSRTA
jgi:selenium-binding protein 1